MKKEYFHIYNRGVDKRELFVDIKDFQRLLQSMHEFNTLNPIGSIYENSFRKEEEKSQLGSSTPKLVEFVAFCVNPNHFHFILAAEEMKNISEFMRRLGTGYTNYFNERHQRTGSLFSGRYKKIHVTSNEYLLYLSAYVNLNYRVHQIPKTKMHLVKSSWDEYIGKSNENFCEKRIILDQFKSREEYREFAEEALEIMLENKEKQRELDAILQGDLLSV